MATPSNAKAFYSVLFLAVILIAIAFRAPSLNRRPMHTDEAVHAVKFGMLLEEGFYRYDRTEYHGPTLNYFTLIPAWLESAKRLADVDESMVRIVPVVFGIGLIPLLLLLRQGLGREATVVAAFLTAVSPAMVFYSRYYIQEMLLVFFAFAVLVSAYRYLRSGQVGWAIATGVGLGLMHATKETAVMVSGAMLGALLLTLLTNGQAPASSRADLLRHGSIMLASAFLVSALFYSSFFTNPNGIVDSYTTYATYVDRATQNERHVHPWHYYVGMLLYFKASGPVWTEALIVLLAGLGILAAANKVDLPGVDVTLVRFLSFYAVITMIVFSAIPYKTPWNMLVGLHGLILLAGVGVTAAFRMTSGRVAKATAVVFLVVGGVHLAQQSYLASYKYQADSANPYVYAHPTHDVFRIANRVNRAAEAHPDGSNMRIDVISPDHEYWPLPWYLRSFPNVGWWSKVSMELPAAPVILASPSMESGLLTKFYELPRPGERNLYLPLFQTYTELRPTVEIRGYVTKDLWDRYQGQVMESEEVN